MKNLEQLKSSMQEVIERLEAERKRQLSAFKLIQKLLVIPIILFVAAAASMLIIPQFWYLAIALMVGASALLGWMYVQQLQKPKQLYREQFKSQFFKEMVANFYPSMHYQPDNYVPKVDFYKSHLFHGKANEGYTGEDYFSGVVAGMNMRFSEVNAQQLVGKNEVTLFNGIFMVLDIQTQLKGATFIVPDNYEQWLGQLAVKIQDQLDVLREGDLLHLDNAPDFENKFAIYSTNIPEARMILTQELIDSVLWIRKTFESQISLAFQDQQLYIAIPLGHERLFEPELNKSLTADNEMLQRIFAELKSCFDLIHKLPLDQLRKTKN